MVSQFTLNSVAAVLSLLVALAGGAVIEFTPASIGAVVVSLEEWASGAGFLRSCRRNRSGLVSDNLSNASGLSEGRL